VSQQIISLSRRVAITSILFSLAATALFLFSGKVGLWSLNLVLAGLVIALVVAIGAVLIGRQSGAGKSQLPAAAVALAVVLLIAFVGTMAYVSSTLKNFADQ